MDQKITTDTIFFCILILGANLLATSPFEKSRTTKTLELINIMAIIIAAAAGVLKFFKGHRRPKMDQRTNRKRPLGLNAEKSNELPQIIINPDYDRKQPEAPKTKRSMKLKDGKFFNAEIKQKKIRCGIKTHTIWNYSVMSKETAEKLGILEDIVEHRQVFEDEEFIGWLMEVPIIFLGTTYRCDLMVVNSPKFLAGEISLGYEFLLKYGFYIHYEQGKATLCDQHGAVRMFNDELVDHPTLQIEAYIEGAEINELIPLKLWGKPENAISLDCLEEHRGERQKGGTRETWRVKMKAGITDILLKNIKPLTNNPSNASGIMIGTKFLAAREAHIDYGKMLIYLKVDNHYECFNLKVEGWEEEAPTAQYSTLPEESMDQDTIGWQDTESMDEEINGWQEKSESTVVRCNKCNGRLQRKCNQCGQKKMNLILCHGCVEQWINHNIERNNGCQHKRHRHYKQRQQERQEREQDFKRQVEDILERWKTLMEVKQVCIGETNQACVEGTKTNRRRGSKEGRRRGSPGRRSR